MTRYASVSLHSCLVMVASPGKIGTHITISNIKPKVDRHASNVGRPNVGPINETDAVHESSSNDQSPIDASDDVAVGR